MSVSALAENVVVELNEKLELECDHGKSDPGLIVWSLGGVPFAVHQGTDQPDFNSPCTDNNCELSYPEGKYTSFSAIS